MGRHLVLVADSSNARIMEKSDGRLSQLGPVYDRDTLIGDFDKGASKPGRIKKTSSGTHSFAPHSDIHRVEKDQFIKEIAKHLNNGLSNMDSLVLIAPPQTLGELRKQLSANVLSKVEREVGKDLTKMRGNDLLSYVSKPFI